MRFLALFAVVALASDAAAQYHTAGYFSVTWATGGVAFGLNTDTNGTVTSLQLGTAAHYQCEMDLDNRYVLVADSTSQAIWKVDPIGMTIIGTLAPSPTGSFIYGMNYDHNGDLFLASQTAMWRISPTGATATINGAPGARHMGIDPDTGELIIADISSVDLWDRNGNLIQSLGGGFNGRYGDLVKDPLTGDIYVPTCCGGLMRKSLHVLKRGSGTSSVFLNSTDLLGAYGPNLDRISAANPRLVTGSAMLPTNPNSGGMWYIDVATAAPTRFAKWPQTTIADSTILESRNLQTVRTAPGRYDVRINIPSEGQKAYILGLSLTGINPTVPLPDGRRLPLAVDGLTVLSAHGSLAPFVTGTVGVIDPFGRASAKIDVSGILELVRGANVWMVCVVLHGQAPLGISVITDPFVLKFD